MKIKACKLRLNGERRKEGPEVEAKIAIGDSGQILFEVSEDGGTTWRQGDPDEVHALSWLRALGETGQKVGGE